MSVDSQSAAFNELKKKRVFDDITRASKSNQSNSSISRDSNSKHAKYNSIDEPNQHVKKTKYDKNDKTSVLPKRGTTASQKVDISSDEDNVATQFG
ncbi:unnamed protein product, partial [Didymodactylos carnosus]